MFTDLALFVSGFVLGLVIAAVSLSPEQVEVPVEVETIVTETVEVEVLVEIPVPDPAAFCQGRIEGEVVVAVHVGAMDPPTDALIAEWVANCVRDQLPLGGDGRAPEKT